MVSKFQIAYWIVAFFFVLSVIGMILAFINPISRRILLSSASIDRWIGFLILAYLFYTLKDWRICAAAEGSILKRVVEAYN